MVGETSKRLNRKTCCLFLISLVFLSSACGRHRVAVEQRPFPADRKGIYHTVERHQTLYRICKTYGVDLREVASLNGISDPGRIQVGQRIFIPGARKVLKVDIYIEDVVEESGKREKRVDTKLKFIWPVEGKLTDRFDETEGKRHMGIDISSPTGTPIKASCGGRVIYSGNTIRGYGNLILIRHSEDYVSVYAHNEINLVDEGEYVEAGQVIGRIGRTGQATGPHLHFEIRKNNRPFDPLLILQ